MIALRAAAAFLLIAVAGCSSAQEAAPEATFPAQSPPPASAPATATPSASRAPSPSPSLVENNGTMESPLTDFKATVRGHSWATSLTDPSKGTTKPQGRYLLVRITMRNITKHPVHPPAHLSLHTADGSEYAPEWDQTFGQTVLVGRGKLNDLNPGATTTVVLVNDVPQGTKPAAVATLKLPG